MTAATAPFELGTLGLDRDNFKRSDGKSWRGPCPRCGGERRFVIWTDHAFPKWNFACDRCGTKGFADQLNAAVKQELTPEQKRAFAAQKAAEQKARDDYRRKKLAEFAMSELQQEIDERLTEEHRRQWREWGVPDSWQDYLRLGYLAHKKYTGLDGELCTSPAYKIPYHHAGFELVTVQYRLFNPPNPADRYRWEAGLGTAYYMTQPDQAMRDEVLICEGAKKSIVAAVFTPENYTVLAVPSKSDFGGIVDAVKDCGRVYILLDPDAGVRARKLAREIGPAVRIASLPVKVDDALVMHGLTTDLLLDTLRVARPL